MRTYDINTAYEFIVNYFYTTLDDNGEKKHWLSLSDGDTQRKYNVPAYPYQQYGFEGKTITCEVIKVLDNGYLYLRQNKADILKGCYKKGETHWFSVLEELVDRNSHKPYLRLLDRRNGLEHRFYCSGQNTPGGGACWL